MEKPRPNDYEGMTPQIMDRMRSAVERNFGEDSVYALTSGSIVFGGAIPGQSDMDMLVVLKKSFKDKPRNQQGQQVRGFVDDYLQLHHDTGFMPDTVFPGEYIIEDQVADAISGRGYHVDGQGKLYLPQASDDYYMEDPERWHRAWLSMSAYGEFVSGDKDKFLRNKEKAWGTVILFNAGDLEEPTTPNGIIDRLSAPANKWAGSGISERYFTFRQHELPFASSALEMLTDTGYFTREGDIFHPDQRRIAEWHQGTSDAIRSGTIRRADYLFGVTETGQIASYAEGKWQEITAR
jgi:hypothetical protein